MNDLSKLAEQLSEIGIISVIKDDYVFTLYMINDTKFLDSGGIPFKVLQIVTNHILDKPNIEVFKNDSNFILLVLKP
jgi:hypothetical protein